MFINQNDDFYSMFKWYGKLGILLVLFAEINFVLKIEPFARWYFPIIWFGYIFIIDAINYKISKKSLLMTDKKHFFIMLILSTFFWITFEIINQYISNWQYNTVDVFKSNIEKGLFALLSFSTVLPAIFETYFLIQNTNLFNHRKLKHKHNITKRFLHIMYLIGIICLISPIIFPKFTFPLVWASFFFLLDPINYLHKKPSIISHLKDRNLKIPLSLMLAGLITGFFWEFWNYYAIPKWFYNIPYVSFFKIFEMPILGYLGYLPFALELYAMYYFFTQTLHDEEIKIFKLIKNKSSIN